MIGSACVDTSVDMARLLSWIQDILDISAAGSAGTPSTPRPGPSGPPRGAGRGRGCCTGAERTTPPPSPPPSSSCPSPCSRVRPCPGATPTSALRGHFVAGTMLAAPCPPDLGLPAGQGIVYRLELETKVHTKVCNHREGPSRGPLRDYEIFVNLNLTFVSMFKL